MSALFGKPLSVVNIGLDAFADPPSGAGAKVTRTDWRPAGGDAEVARAVARLLGDPRVEAANKEAFGRYLEASPALDGAGIARETLPGMGDRMILHSGPPIVWERMCGPMRGGIVGAILLEGWAADAERAMALAAGGEITFEPCHHHDAVGPMAGIISPSMPVWIVHNPVHGNRTFSNMNEGLGKVLRMGANSPEVLERLRWMRDTLFPAMAKALAKGGPIELKPLMARALHMGDEVHNRNVAASSLLLKRITPSLLRSGVAVEDIAQVFDFVKGNDHFFINVGMAACKAMLDPARGVPGSSMVTVMARNGVEFGIRVSGTGDTWFTGPARPVDGLFFAGFTKADAAGDIGDSAITETAGVGGFAMAAAPAIVQFVGGTPASAIENTLRMGHITLGRNSAFTLPQLDFAGSPAGIDIRKVVDTGILPVVNTGIAHKEPGIGQVGAGVTSAPMECFLKAVPALAATDALAGLP
ncbi:MAG: DUF1116 domain-containing protein [Burkholderiales bacterium]